METRHRDEAVMRNGDGARHYGMHATEENWPVGTTEFGKVDDMMGREE